MLIGYARVSTQDQSSELQLDALRQSGCEKILEEKVSGARQDRPQLAEALKYMRSGDILVVWKMDRLARSLKQLIETVEDLEKQEMGFRSLTENIDTTSPSGKLVFHLFGALAEFERSLIKERTIAGLLSAKARGRVGGRPRALSTKDVVKAKAMLRDPDLTVQEIADTFSVSLSTLYTYIPGGRSATQDEG